ncbi:MAG TPA: hypothetical protein DEP66_03130 [Acidimicrobiaceae bacterium]|nr:hypothetical protein [Acidimicrobiaceae bacterium]
MNHAGLQELVEATPYGNLPESWVLTDGIRFTSKKSLYDYQRSALENAARALYMYYAIPVEDEFHSTTARNEDRRKQLFAARYGAQVVSDLSISRFDTLRAEETDSENVAYSIFKDFFVTRNDVVDFWNLANRMCFWMATGSGKTLIMVKMIEHLCHLIDQGNIPNHKVLLLAPSDLLLRQIRKAIEEFNQDGDLTLRFLPLRDDPRIGNSRPPGRTLDVLYHRSDLISDTQKTALTNYRQYDNGGRWYLILDEAHKGGKEESKRQAYYAVLSRNGFLFNFSATFTEQVDSVTTVKKYGLTEFTGEAYGKRIYLSQSEASGFKETDIEFNWVLRRQIVLKSLVTLGFISIRAKQLRLDMSLPNLYHAPLMLTLVNSVNTERLEKNDLWCFFDTLRSLAAGEITDGEFASIVEELGSEWESHKCCLPDGDFPVSAADLVSLSSLSLSDVRRAVFHSKDASSLQVILGADPREMAFQLKSADQPFALIRIGDTRKWRSELLAGFEETHTLQTGSYFDALATSSITMLLGSRSFFESWDSPRPNVISFINIGSKDAKKFVIQSIGRGVRLEPIAPLRGRLERLRGAAQLENIADFDTLLEQVKPVETLFLYATNRGSMQTVLQGIELEAKHELVPLAGFELSPPAKLPAGDLPLLVPRYRAADKDTSQQVPRFGLSSNSLRRLRKYYHNVSDTLLIVRDKLTPTEVTTMRTAVSLDTVFRVDKALDYPRLDFLRKRHREHLAKRPSVSDGVRILAPQDIVHFRKIRASRIVAHEIQLAVDRVRQGHLSDEKVLALAEQLRERKISREEFDQRSRGVDSETTGPFNIIKMLGHYYVPLLTAASPSEKIEHVVTVQSEIEFLQDLTDLMTVYTPPWESWMFSKLDESVDQIYIPYFDILRNSYHRFFPDFIFWMCTDQDYRIVFVDPKSIQFSQADEKVAGFKELFTSPDLSPKSFDTEDGFKVTVDLLMYNKQSPASRPYPEHWTSSCKAIFEQT